MEIKGKTKIYKNQYGYSISDSQKKQDGNYEQFYYTVKFPQKMAITPNDKEIIEFTGFTKPYKNKDGVTQLSIMIMDWKSLGVEQPKQNKTLENYDENPITGDLEQIQKDPYQEFSQENGDELKGLEFPF